MAGAWHSRTAVSLGFAALPLLDLLMPIEMLTYHVYLHLFVIYVLVSVRVRVTLQWVYIKANLICKLNT